MSLFIPFFYIVIGYGIGKIWNNASNYISFLLINIFIPIVIFITLLKYNNGIYQILILSFIFSVSMYLISNLIYNEPTLKLSFSYYNIGWLGLPIAVSIFGDIASTTILAAYIGGMLYGATFGIYSLNKDPNNTKKEAIKKLITSAPFIAFISAIFLKSNINNIEFLDKYSDVYLYSKYIMSFLGMSILGIWLEKNKIDKKSIHNSILFTIKRLLVGLLVLFLYLFVLYQIDLINYKEATYLLILPFLPIAANITVLEAYYLKHSKSTTLIMINTLLSLVFLLIIGILYKLFI